MKRLILALLLSGCSAPGAVGPEPAAGPDFLFVQGAYTGGELEQAESGAGCGGVLPTLDPNIKVAQAGGQVAAAMGPYLPDFHGYVTDTGFWAEGSGAVTEGGALGLGLELSVPGSEVLARVSADVTAEYGDFEYEIRVLQLGVETCRALYIGRLARNELD